MEEVARRTLSKPILFLDLFKWVIFDGKVKKETLRYKKIIPPFSIVDELLIDKIKKGIK